MTEMILFHLKKKDFPSARIEMVSNIQNDAASIQTSRQSSKRLCENEQLWMSWSKHTHNLPPTEGIRYFKW